MEVSKLESLIKEIAKAYFESFNYLKEIKQRSLSNGKEDIDSPLYRYYLDVELAYYRLNKEYRSIINNEFFYQRYKEWWKETYSPSVFNIKKKEAMKLFLEAFYEIH